MGGFSQIAGLLPQAPRTTALKDYGEIQDGIAKMRQVQADAAMRQQQALAQQQEREDVARKQQAWKNSIAKAKDLDEAANLYAQESGDVETAQKVLEGLSQIKERYSKLETEKLAQRVKRDEIVTGILEGINTNSGGDANRLWSEYQANAGELQSLGVPQFTHPEGVQSYINTHKLGGTLPKQELANREIKVAELRAQTDADKGKRDAEQVAREMAYQDLSAVSNQSAYDQWRQEHPAEAKALPPNFDAGAIKAELRRAVPIAKQFEIDDKSADNVRQMQAQELAERREAELERHNRASEERMARLAASGLGNQQATRINQVASQFDNEPLVRDYNQIAQAKQFVDSLGTGKDATATNDQGLIYAFAKAMDPGSVVREGEYATVQKYSQSWANKFGFQAQRIFSNSPFLTEEARRQMKDTIAQKLGAVKGQYDNVHNEYARRINKVGGVQDGSEYLTDYSKFSDSKPTNAQGKPKPKITKVEVIE